MNIEEIKTIVKLMSDYQLTEFSVEADGCNVSIKRGTAPAAVVVPAAAAIPAAPAAVPTAEPVKQAKEKVVETTIVSPLVGTYYSSPSPDTPPFVSVGDKVTPDTVVCIIEAMKVMNEVKAEKSGIVKEILVENGQPVEFGQVILVLE